MRKFVTTAFTFIATTTVATAFSPQELADRTIERRTVEAVIWGIPAVNYDLMLQEMLTNTKAKPNQILYQTLTPNPDAIYLIAFVMLKTSDFRA